MSQEATEHRRDKKGGSGASLVVQRLRLHAPNAGSPGCIPGQGTRSHLQQLKKILHPTTETPHMATKTPCSQTHLKGGGGTNSHSQYQEETMTLASGSLKAGPRGKQLSSAGVALTHPAAWLCHLVMASFTGATFPRVRAEMFFLER